MAREPQVTRTIVTTKVTATCVNLETNAVEETEFILPRTYKDNKALLKALSTHNTETYHVVAVKSTTTEQTLYAMTESDFIKHAKVLPARVSKISE